MIRELDRNAVWLGKTRRRNRLRGCLLLRHFHLPFHFANSRKVFVELAAVGGTEPTLQSSRIIGHEIEDALLIPCRTGACGGVSGALVRAKQAFEHSAWIHFGRIRNGRRAPRDAVYVSAAIT